MKKKSWGHSEIKIHKKQCKINPSRLPIFFLHYLISMVIISYFIPYVLTHIFRLFLKSIVSWGQLYHILIMTPYPLLNQSDILSSNSTSLKWLAGQHIPLHFNTEVHNTSSGFRTDVHNTPSWLLGSVFFCCQLWPVRRFVKVMPNSVQQLNIYATAIDPLKERFSQWKAMYIHKIKGSNRKYFESEYIYVVVLLLTSVNVFLQLKPQLFSWCGELWITRIYDHYTAIILVVGLLAHACLPLAKSHLRGENK